MAIYLPGVEEDQALSLDEMTPRQIVAELDKYVVGQHAAKRAVAIALRNRMRRQKLGPELADDIMPKNIIMIGPTGVGKTEIARRLAKLTNSPFLKVEASKFTEVGYVGRDVESMIRDLVEIAIDMLREEKLEDVEDKAELNAEERLLDILLPPAPAPAPGRELRLPGGVVIDAGTSSAESSNRTREKLRQQLREGKLDERTVEIDVRERNFPSFEILTNQGVEEMDVNIKDMLPNIFGQRTKKRKMKVNEAFEYLIQEEEQRLIDMDQVTRMAIDRVENSGIVFLDEIDKIAGREGGHGPGCFTRRRAARHSADRRRHNRKHALWHGAHRPHSVYCRGRVSRIEAERFDSRTAGALSDSRGTAIADHGRLRADSDRAEIFAGKTVHRVARYRGREAGVHEGSAGRDCALCVPREREHGEHWSATPAHNHGASAGRVKLRCTREKGRARYD